MRIRPFASSDTAAYEAFVDRCAGATLFHRVAWRTVIADSLRQNPVYLLAEDERGIVGVLPLFIVRTGFFGTMAVSMPFLNYGGVAATDDEAARLLLAEAEKLAREHGCDYVEYRHRYSLPAAAALPTNDFKVTSILDLRPGVEIIWKDGLHQNVRNKIRKAEKNEVSIRCGADLLAAFYGVFAANQHAHGTPVLPRSFFRNILTSFGDDVRIYAAFKDGRPIGAKLTIDFRETRYFIWSASLRAGNSFAPVPAMNWTAIQDAAAKGLAAVDFGRSTRDSSSLDFKKYWSVTIEPLYWQYQLIDRTTMPGLNTANRKFELAIRLWRRLPLFVSRLLGPSLARRLP